MDAAASSQNQKLFDSYFLQIQKSHFPTQRQGCSIKYTKLPDFDFDMKVLWPQRDSYVLQPRLRRIITLNDQENIMRMSRSLRSELGVPLNLMSSYTKRKIATISEVEEIETHTVSKAGVKKLDITRKPRKPICHDEVNVPKTKSTISEPSRHLAKTNIKYGAKSSNIINNKKNNVSKQETESNALIANQQPRNSRLHFLKDNEKPPPKKKILEQSNVSRYNLQKTNRSSPSPPIERKLFNKNKSENLKNTTGSKLSLDKPKSPKGHRNEFIIFKDVPKTKHPKLIRVPTESPPVSENKTEEPSDVSQSVTKEDRYVSTDPEPRKVDVVTEVDPEINLKTNSCIQTDSIEMLGLNSQFGNLDVPSVTLIRDRSEESGAALSKQSQSLPELQMPSVKISPRKENRIPEEEMQIYKKDSFIIGRATLTYTTQKKIDFHVLGQNETNVTSPSSYPLTAVSAFKNQLKKNSLDELSRKKEPQKSKQKLIPKQDKSLRASKSLDCCYALNNSKLVKPSELISTIRVNNGLLQSNYICEQFQRELNFIDSFFESLQYLENCSSNNILTDKKVENFVTQSGFDCKNPEYNSFFSKFENEANNEDSETMASKSLCLLNLLIRDEQRRAKNLLFVLKMREDALKDFTKSQILWLENKKKQDNTDISTLKKKQRGALLKLQHECGEMQRMRKALLTLSEKRRIALMKTKKNIELKLKNNVKVDQIFLSKNKLKRNTNERAIAPLKCFDLSSSGCDDSTTLRLKSDSALVSTEILPKVHFTEKSSQTGESIHTPVTIDRETDTTAENFITVDGGYLNILFQNLSLPEIFSSGKQYEVNEEALRSIVASANSHRSAAITDSNLIERFIEKIKSCDQDLSSSSPSTAHSLVEELDQYYKNFTEEDKSRDLPPEKEHSETRYEEKSVNVSLGNTESQAQRSASCSEVSKVSESVHVDFKLLVCDKMTDPERRSEATNTQADPLPGPVGAPDPPSAGSKHSHTELYQGESSIVVEMSSLPAPVHNEAEELLRQQLAIEREIKALEQQQQHLLVVREIPDKPPPPYTPPTEIRLPSTTRMYFIDETIEQKVRTKITNNSETTDSSSAFDVFLADFCEESVQKLRVETSNYPWDACNLLPHKPLLDVEQLVEKTKSDLKEVLTGTPPIVISGVSSRKSDHIDDILFAEWRRCEPEWTTLHAEEAQVKSQLFEAIFQRILNDTIDEYKKTVLSSDSDDSDDSVALPPISHG